MSSRRSCEFGLDLTSGLLVIQAQFPGGTANRLRRTSLLRVADYISRWHESRSTLKQPINIPTGNPGVKRHPAPKSVAVDRRLRQAIASLPPFHPLPKKRRGPLPALVLPLASLVVS